MTSASDAAQSASLPSSRRSFAVQHLFGAIALAIAALAMVATLPGRTHGLGLITERLLADPALQLDRVTFGDLNIAATLIGALFGIGYGRLMDRIGVRWVLVGTLALLAVNTWWMTTVTGFWSLAVAITLSRGIGQTALSAASLTLVGKWYNRGITVAMGLFTVLMMFGFAMSYHYASEAKMSDWRSVWNVIAIGVGLLAIVSTLLLRREPTPRELGRDTDHEALVDRDITTPEESWTLWESLGTQAFWLLALASSFYGLIAAGASLWGQSILMERGFPGELFYTMQKKAFMYGLATNLIAGLVGQFISLERLMAAAMAVMAATLFCYQFLNTEQHVLYYTIGMSVSGGIVTVLFFTAWRKRFGSAHLGSIQTVAQVCTVVASAVGPAFFARTQAATGSYRTAFLLASASALALGIWAIFVPVPKRSVKISSHLQNSA